MAPAPAFRLFGFPVHVRAGFWMFMVLIVFINGADLGLWLAAFIAVFTLVHELGHAFAARATGARAEISLDFMAGYASFVPTRHLARWERAAISFAGPAAQILTGGVAYLAVHGEFSMPYAHQHIQIAVLWAGPVIGAANLVPVLPFDGGNILEQLVSVFTQHARRIMMWFTLALMGAALAYSAVEPSLRPFMIFMIVPLISVAQMRSAERAHGQGVPQPQQQRQQQDLARAEALAWATGDVSLFSRDQLPSPWFRAHQQLTQGHPDIARQLLLSDLADNGPVNWWPPDAAPAAHLRALVDLLPRPLPAGGTFRSFVLTTVLLRLGDYDTAAHFAAATYQRDHAAMHAIHVARAAAALGDRAVAIGWLRTAAAGAPARAVAAAVNGAPEFETLRHDPEFEAALAGTS